MPDLLTNLQAALADRYRVERELGRGGMATVYLAQDLKHDRPVALKVLHPELATSVGPDRFLREIRIAAKLTHPHILPLHDSGEVGRLLYYAMPFVEGESLRGRLQREVQLPLDDALRIAREVAEALAYAHRHGVLHRDIKPENILLEDGQAVVADFGVARAIDLAGAERLTETGLAVGTPAYMSPEQSAGERAVDGRSDIYALGCVLYEMLAGEPPFTGPSAQAVIAKRFAEPVPHLRTVRDVPAPVEDVVTRALARVPADRFATAEEFAAALANLAGAAALGPVAERKRWPRIQWLAVFVVAGGAALAAMLLARRERSPIIPSASLIAVLPPTPASHDTALSRLGRDLAATLSANLDGVGEIRTVDHLTILAQTRDRAEGYTLEEAAALARRLGARSVVQGSLARRGTQVRIDLGLYTTDSLTAVGHASVTAPGDDIDALTDSAAWALLRQVWRSGSAPTPSLGDVTTRSLPALRAFLEGERAMIDSRWRHAEEAYGRAIEADSTFWLAYWRLANAREWLSEPVDSMITARYRQHRAMLPERERLIIESRMGDTRSRRIELAREAATRFPDYWPAWMEYADHLVHGAPLLGYTARDARAALDRTVALNPRLVPAWDHLAWMSIGRDDTAAARTIAMLSRLRADSGLTEEYGPEVPFIFRFVRTDSVADRSLRAALADSIARALTQPAHPFPPGQATYLAWLGLPKEQIEVSRRALRLPGTAQTVTARNLWGIAIAWASLGAWDSAVTAGDAYRRTAGTASAALSAYRLAVVGSWLGGLPPAAASSRREVVARARGDLGESERAELVWLDGLLGFARGDLAALRTARQGLARQAGPAAFTLGRSLTAFHLKLIGALRAAADTLAALEWERAELPNAAEGDDYPYLTGIDRLALAPWLAAVGDTAQATRALTFPEAVHPSAKFEAAVPLAAPAYLELARLHDAAGLTDLARYEYEQFLRRYSLPTPANRPLIDEARAALERLGRLPD